MKLSQRTVEITNEDIVRLMIIQNDLVGKSRRDKPGAGKPDDNEKMLNEVNHVVQSELPNPRGGAIGMHKVKKDRPRLIPLF
jgi:hypothetical protein